MTIIITKIILKITNFTNNNSNSLPLKLKINLIFFI
jgi:hypothetical protein